MRLVRLPTVRSKHLETAVHTLLAQFEELLTNAMLFVLPSDLEGLSLALLEAMGAGWCVLAVTFRRIGNWSMKQDFFFKRETSLLWSECCGS
jgi:Glycosyl transferases group 1